MNIGGMASSRGITFSSEGRQVRVTGDGRGSLSVRSRQTRGGSILDGASRIPFLRGLAAFARIRPMWALLLLAVAVDILPVFSGDDIGMDGIVAWALLGILAVLLVVRLFFLKDLLRYHAAEHMALNTYEASFELTVENIARAPRTHARCGTMLAIYLVVATIPCALWIPYVSLALLVVVSVAFELFLEAPKLRALRWLSTIGLWLQKTITTAPPEPRHIEAARLGLMKLIEQEEK